MKFYVIIPAIGGQLGDRTVLDSSMHPPRIEHLHYRFEGWWGDELLASFPVYICSERVAEALESAKMNGFRLANLDVSREDQFRRMYPDTVLPKFRWLQVTGVAEPDDFGLRNSTLVVSDKALHVLRAFMPHAEIQLVQNFELNPSKRMDQLLAEAKALADQLQRTREGEL